MFRFHSNQMSQATRGIAKMIFIVGLLLVGFGVLIMKFPEVFASIAAFVFFFAGASTISYAVKIFIASRGLSKHENNAFRDNVRIHDPDEER